MGRAKPSAVLMSEIMGWDTKTDRPGPIAMPAVKARKNTVKAAISSWAEFSVLVSVFIAISL
jgi:hypothetical protein